MGKTVLAENDVQETILKLIDKQGFIIGLIVGKVSLLVVFCCNLVITWLYRVG